MSIFTQVSFTGNGLNIDPLGCLIRFQLKLMADNGLRWGDNATKKGPAPAGPLLFVRFRTAEILVRSQDMDLESP